MEAVFRDGGRQYKVSEGTTLDIDFREVEDGSTLEFPEVLFVSGEGDARIGSPLVDGARVTAKVLGESKGPKLIVMHFRRRKNSKTRVGHRQKHTRIQIEKIDA